MSPALLTLIGVLFSAVAGTAGIIGASTISKRAGDRQREAQAAIDNRKVDREDFDSLTRELRKSIEDLREDLETERGERRRAERRVAQLEEVLRANGMPIPPPD